ncbi:MAG: hypothetical protein SPL08_05060 [Pseudomonadota bacterium]|nr:hypothetical protein [Pseudomonadota bacterium]
MAKQKKLSESEKVIQKYDALSPMMKIIFSSEAQLRYAEDKSLTPILDELTHADKLAHTLLKWPFQMPAQAELHINSAMRKYQNHQRKKNILTYTINALTIGDSIVSRMAYAHGQIFPSMKDFEIIHPILIDAPTLQRQIALLKRFNRTSFSIRNPQCSKYYRDWATSTASGRTFNQRKSIYVLALSSVLKEAGISFRKIPLPYIGIGRAFIKEVSRERS